MCSGCWDAAVRVQLQRAVIKLNLISVRKKIIVYEIKAHIMHIISQLREVVLCERAVSEKDVEGKIIHGFMG